MEFSNATPSNTLRRRAASGSGRMAALLGEVERAEANGLDLLSRHARRQSRAYV